ncbi:MAG: prepilin peptidase [Bdellovibrionales bacterium]
MGAVAGSFANALIYRVPLGISFVKARDGKAVRSMCPHCKHQLSFFDLVPILSWLFLQGRCRYCDHEIGARYVLLELFAASVGVLIMLLVADVVFASYLFLVMPFFVTMIAIFLRYKDFSMIRFLGLIIVMITIAMFTLSRFV